MGLRFEDLVPGTRARSFEPINSLLEHIVTPDPSLSAKRLNEGLRRFSFREPFSNGQGPYGTQNGSKPGSVEDSRQLSRVISDRVNFGRDQGCIKDPSELVRAWGAERGLGI